MDDNQGVNLTPEQILQGKIDELVKTVSDLQRQNAQLQVNITDLKIQLDASNHLLDAKTQSASNDNDGSELIDEDDLSEALMSGNYSK